MKSIDEIRRANLLLLRDEFGSLKKLAQVIERDDSQVSQWTQGSKNSGTGKARGMRSDTARHIESKTGKQEGWLDQNHARDSDNDASFLVSDGGRQGFAFANVEDAPALRHFRNVPVVGTVQGGDKGYLLELEHAPGHGDGVISYPARDHQSYAVRVRGDSMRPRIKAGEFIVVEPNHECQPGDDVVVVLKDGQRMVKELLYIRDGEATLGSINNGHANITVAMREVEKMHYVAAIIPRGAFYKA